MKKYHLNGISSKYSVPAKWDKFPHNQPLKWLFECNNKQYHSLTHYSLLLLIYTPWKQKTFSDVFRGIDKQHRAVMG